MMIYPSAVSRSLIRTGLLLTFFAGNTLIYRVRLHQGEKKDFEYAIEQSMKIDFVYKYLYIKLLIWSLNLARDFKK